MARGLVLDQLQDAVIVTDPDGRVVDVNRTGTQLLRRAAPHLPERMIGAPIRSVVEDLGLPVPLVDGEFIVATGRARRAGGAASTTSSR